MASVATGTTELTETHNDVYCMLVGQSLDTQPAIWSYRNTRYVSNCWWVKLLTAGKRRYVVSYCSNAPWKESVWDGKAGRGCDDQTRTHTHIHTRIHTRACLVDTNSIKFSFRCDQKRNSFLKDFSFNISQRLALFPLRRSIDLRLKMTCFKHLHWEIKRYCQNS